MILKSANYIQNGESKNHEQQGMPSKSYLAAPRHCAFQRFKLSYFFVFNPFELRNIFGVSGVTNKN
jgi:hypothetical protein